MYLFSDTIIINFYMLFLHVKTPPRPEKKKAIKVTLPHSQLSDSKLKVQISLNVELYTRENVWTNISPKSFLRCSEFNGGAV